MSDDDRIDFSALDPSADSRRWERLVARTTARALATRRPTLLSELARLTWPLVTGAALVAGMAIFLSRLPSAASSSDSVSAESFSDWANQGEIPRSVDVFELTGDRG